MYCGGYDWGIGGSTSFVNLRMNIRTGNVSCNTLIIDGVDESANFTTYLSDMSIWIYPSVELGGS